MYRTWHWVVCAERIFDKMKIFPPQEKKRCFSFTASRWPRSLRVLRRVICCVQTSSYCTVSYFCQWRWLISWFSEGSYTFSGKSFGKESQSRGEMWAFLLFISHESCWMWCYSIQQPASEKTLCFMSVVDRTLKALRLISVSKWRQQPKAFSHWCFCGCGRDANTCPVWIWPSYYRNKPTDILWPKIISDRFTFGPDIYSPFTSGGWQDSEFGDISIRDREDKTSATEAGIWS